MGSAKRATQPIRRLVSASMVGALLTIPGACGSPPPNDLPSDERLPELQQLVSTVNGLYYAPFLRAGAAGVEDNAYALRIRRLIDRQPPQLSLSTQSAVSFHDDAVAASPLQGRSWLAPIATAGATGLLTDADIRAVRALRHTDGSFLEPNVDDSEARRAVDTASALEILAARNAVTAEDRRITGQWLDNTLRRTSSIRTAADAARGLTLLGLPVPAVTVTAPRFMGDFGRLNQSERYMKLLDAYSVAVIAQARREVPNVDRAVWQSVLVANALKLDYRDLYYLVAIAVAGGAPESDLAPARSRIENERLPDGSVRNNNNLAGTPGNSIWALRLRRQAGDTAHDPAQISALNTAARERAPSSWAEQLQLNEALLLAGDDRAYEAVIRLCRAKVMLRDPITETNVEVWSQVALACAEAGTSVAPPTVRQWPMTDPPAVAAAATLITGLVDGGLASGIPAWITPAQLRDWAANPERVTSTRAYANIVRAFLIVGGDMSGDIAAAIRRSIDTRKGCPQLPSLYRGDALEAGCDLKATWAVWKLRAFITWHVQNPKPLETRKPKQGP